MKRERCKDSPLISVYFALCHYSTVEVAVLIEARVARGCTTQIILVEIDLNCEACKDVVVGVCVHVHVKRFAWFHALYWKRHEDAPAYQAMPLRDAQPISLCWLTQSFVEPWRCWRRRDSR